MSYNEKINELKELLKDSGYEKYLGDFARILYKYIKDSEAINESDLKATLETIATELDYSLTKEELLNQFAKLVKDRISMNFLARKAKEFSELDFLYQEYNHLKDLIENMKMEYEYNPTEELFKQIQEYERELAKLENEIKKLENKEYVKRIKKEIKNNLKKKNNNKNKKKIVIKRVAKSDNVKVTNVDKVNNVNNVNNVNSQQFSYLLSLISELRSEIKELRNKLESLKVERSYTKDSSDLELKLNEIKKDIDYLKSELLNLFNAIALVKEEHKEEKKERKSILLRLNKKKILLIALLVISSPFLFIGFILCIMILPLIAIFLSPYLIVILIKKILQKYRRGVNE